MKLKGPPSAWLSFAMIVGVMSTALISPLYALYQSTWQLQASDVSIIYVLYMGGALTGLLFLGRLTDRIGFLPMMRGGLVLVFLGTLISLLAKDMLVLGAGRFIVGVASSMVTTSASAGMMKLSRSGNAQRAAMMTGLLMAFGFGLGPLVGGIIGQWLPSPLITAYIPTLLLGVLALFALFTMQAPRDASAPPRRLGWQDVLPRLTWPEKSVSSAFALTCCMPFLAFGVFGLYASMAPLFLDQLVPWHGPVVSGSAIALILFCSAAVQRLAARLPAVYCGTLGLLSLALSNALLIANLLRSSSLLFGMGVLFTALGHGLTMLAGMNIINRLAGPAPRSGLLATYLLIGYVGSMIPMMGLGWIADIWGMDLAVQCFCVLIIVVSTPTAVYFFRHPRIRG